MSVQPASKLSQRSEPDLAPTPDRASPQGKQKRGFALLAARDPEAHRALSARGAKVAHELGVAHEFDEDEARSAGRKGGLATQAKKKGNGHAAR